MLRVIILFLPVIFPSWRFFRAVEPSPRIEVLRDGVWVESHPRPARISIWRQLRRMILNPRWNRYLYSVSLSERLVVSPSVHSRSELDEILGEGGTVPPFRITFVHEDAGEIVGFVEYESTEGDAP